MISSGRSSFLAHDSGESLSEAYASAGLLRKRGEEGGRGRPGALPAVLVVSANRVIGSRLSTQLELQGCTVRWVSNGEAASKKIGAETMLVLVDLSTNASFGLEVCRRIKSSPASEELPMILLCRPSGVLDRIVGFEIGADDCVDIQCDPRELSLRVRAVLRRSQTRSADSVIVAGPIVIDRAQCSAQVNGRAIQLTATEFRLLALLVSRAGIVQNRDTLLDEIWGDTFAIDSRSVDTYLRRIRSKLGEAARCLKTIRGLGYCVSVDEGGATE